MYDLSIKLKQRNTRWRVLVQDLFIKSVVPGPDKLRMS